MVGIYHFEKKIGAMTPCYNMTNKNDNFVKIKRRILVYKDARFITLIQLYTFDDSECLVSKCKPVIPCTVLLN